MTISQFDVAGRSTCSVDGANCLRSQPVPPSSPSPCELVSRIFGSLAFLAVVMMTVTIAIGLPIDLNGHVGNLRELNERVRQLETALPANSNTSYELETTKAEIQENRATFGDQRAMTSLHMLLGVATALAIVFVCSVAITYFIGTSRWCREVVEAYGLDTGLIAESQLLKRRAFPWAIVGILTALAVGALGAASDPGTGSLHTASWVTPHLIAALAGICLISWCFYSLWNHISQNHLIIERVMQCVRGVRAAKGLES